jgi:N-acetylglucosaminyldiphosphoundecaprenol N-acetyl-beta-D-mannosaminyltransferase
MSFTNTKADSKKRFRALTTPLTVTSYQDLSLYCYQNEKQSPVIALDFTNIHIVTLRAHDAHFAAVTSCMDHFIPDGMPLIWLLNLHGAGIKDRVYGPTFMRECIRNSPAEVRHYFLGGSEDCLQQLLKNLKQLNPRLNVVGARNGYFNEGDGPIIAEEIRRACPDMIWLGLGTPKQQEFIAAHKNSVDHGIWLAVGFAFDVNAGTKKDAPTWMQKAGLTWLYRLCQEPRRLLSRYLKYNSLFVYYSLMEKIPSFGKRRG